MTISYNWISEYIPVPTDPKQISKILTSIGLEVESLESYESIPGGLHGLIVGEVLDSVPHPGADKLKLTIVGIGNGESLRIVCGAPNVSKGQKVVVAPVGATIYPVRGEPMTIKTAKIRGEDSFGMICAEDEIGVGSSHEGIIVLPPTVSVGTAVSDYYQVYNDWIYEIGLTPNRMDAMSHYGVARDVCAYLSHHEQKNIEIKNVFDTDLPVQEGLRPYDVIIENSAACRRFSGVRLDGITVGPSPKWLQEKLRCIGLRPINNIVDITNFILHDTGQPLHAYNADLIAGNRIIVGNLPQGSVFTTLDEKERKLDAEDLMICDGEKKGMCIAGVFGGAQSGVTVTTSNIFLESAWFHPVSIRKTSFRHGLRTDAAQRFEKTVDIGNTVNVLKRAAAMILQIAGGRLSSAVTDVYPDPVPRNKLSVKYAFIDRLSGKSYDHGLVQSILKSLGFGIEKSDEVLLNLEVPYSKPDISLPADIVEEVMRIDGLDNVRIPGSMTITPSSGARNLGETLREKVAGYLVGAGFHEIFTNSITNAAYFSEQELKSGVRMLNNLSSVHNIMRPSMLETGLESLAFNFNRKNTNLRFFEYGRVYHQDAALKYKEEDHLALYLSGNFQEGTWKTNAVLSDLYQLKGLTEAIVRLCGFNDLRWETGEAGKLSGRLVLLSEKRKLAETGTVSRKMLESFDLRQEVFFTDIYWNEVLSGSKSEKLLFQPLPNQLPVYRDLAMIVPASLAFAAVESAIGKINLTKLKGVRLFDVFESEKLGKGKKSLAINLTFLDEEKTLTDREIDGMMNRIILTLEKDLGVEIRKGGN
ncbi:MAG TPA: phenylalanine--tRNA ligase subunit beta [Flavitalea sp.]|nr:phenylalanine--tRNA ligase subunit beta [Flavitalea sp.]